MNEAVSALMWYAAFLISTTCHEAAHAFAGYKMGDLTAFRAGQVSLNPIPHIKREPFGMVIIPLIAFFGGGWMIGWASTPYDPEWAYNYPKKSAAMSAAGPMANFVLVLLSGLLIHLFIWLGYFYIPDSISLSAVAGSVEYGIFPFLAGLLSIFFSLNLILFFFNLLPFPPLDGSGLIPMYLSDENGRRFMAFVRTPWLWMAGLFLSWKFFHVIFRPLHLVFINLLYPGHNYTY